MSPDPSPFWRRLSGLIPALALVGVLCGSLRAQVPQLVNYQGRVAIGTVNFNGSGSFAFALVNSNGTTTYWSNDGTSTAGSQPAAAVTLPVTNGLYAVLLGDTTLPNMTAIPASVWTNADVRLRVWFNDGTHGFQLLTPDQRLAPSGYLPDAAVTTAKLAPGAVSAASIAPGSIGTTQLAAGAFAVPLNASGTTQLAVPNTAYTANNAGSTTFVLPSTANVGDQIQINGASGWMAATTSDQLPWMLATVPALNWVSVASSADGTHLFAIAYGNATVYTSADSGLTWTGRSGLPSALWETIGSSADGTHLVAGAYEGPLYRSADSGVTWAPVTGAGDNIWRSVASSADGSHWVAVGNFCMVTSTDFGATWTTPAGAPSLSWNGVASSADGTHLVAVSQEFSSPTGAICTSADSGVTWTTRNTPPAYIWQCVASSADGTHLTAGNADGFIITSVDSGVTWKTWSPINSGSWDAVASSADGTHLVAVSGKGLYTSTDSGDTWTLQSKVPFSASWIPVACSADGLHIVMASGDGRMAFTALVSGAQGSTARLEYVGNGTWVPVAETSVAAGAIGNSQLAANAVQATNIAGGAVGSGQIASGAVGNAQLSANAVQTGNIATGAIGTAQIANGAVGSAQIAAGAVGNTQLAANAVQAGNIATGAVGTTQIANGAVGSAQIATNAVGSSQIANGSVTNADLANPQITINSSGVLSGGGAVSLGGTLNLSTPAATSANTVSTLVSRDATGSFSAGQITVNAPPGNFVVLDVEGSVTAGTWLRLNNSTTGGNNWNLISSGSGNGEGAGKLIFNDQTSGSVADVLVLDPAGKVGVAQVPVTNALEVNGNASKTTAGSWLANSDRRIKLDIRTVDHALDTLDRVRLVDFRYTAEYRAMHPSLVDRRYLNVIAQEFAQVFPDWVKGSGEKLADGSEILQVDTYPLTIYSAAAVQELHAKLKEKDNEIAALKARLNAQEKELAAQSRQLNTQSEKDRGLESRLSRLEKAFGSSTGRPVLLKTAAPQPEANE